MKKIITGFFLFAGISATAQWNITNGYNATQLGSSLAGNNVNVTNATISGTANQYGQFTYSGAGFPFTDGVILSTGSIFTAPGPNTSGSTTGGMGGPGDPDLSAIAGTTTNDAVSFQFDFEVQSDRIEFQYIFASEEYNEFVGSGFNDVFAFFISGPGITGWENIALVPGTTVPVAINNINNGSYWQFYNDNELGGFDIEFDGFTTPLTAYRENLTPCGVYTLRLVIADAGDAAYDAAVFLQANSLVQGSVTAQTNTANADGIALEGCIQASFTFAIDSVLSTSTTVPFTIGGTATNGVDYQFLDNFLVIPAGDSTATIIINAYGDGITEGQEYIELYFKTSLCGPVDTVTLYIDDADPIEFQITGTDLLCADDGSGVVDVAITGGFPPYTVTLTDTTTGVSTSYSSVPISGLDASTYLVEIEDSYGCTAEAIIVGGDFNAGTTFLPDGTGVSYTSAINISGFNAGQTMTSAAQINNICATMEHSYANDLTIVLEAPNGVQVQLKNVGPTGGAVNACNLGEPVASAPVDGWNNSNVTPGVGYQYCWNNTPVYATMNAIISTTPPGPPPQYTYVSTFGNTLSDYYLPPGSYTPTQSLNGFVGVPLNGTWTLIVTDNYALDNGYIFDWSISLSSDLPDSTVTLNEPDEIIITGGMVSPACGASDGQLDITVAGDFPPFTYLWNTGATTEDLNGIPAGAYTVTVTDANGCTNQASFNVSNSTPATVTSVVTMPSCNGSNNGGINLTVTGGTSPYSYNWSTGATTEDITGLIAGAYTVTIEDAAGCSSVESITVTQPLAITLSGSVTNENCNDDEGMIDLTPAGGTSPYTYLWSNGATIQDITDLTAATYSVTVTDDNGCNASASYSVINLVGGCTPVCDLAISSSTINDETCGNGNGSIYLSVFTTNGPYSILWNTGATTTSLTGLSAGVYSVTITDNNTCSIIQDFTIINQAGTLSISGASTTNENCGTGNGAIDITVAGGALPYSYSWSNGATNQDLTSISAGNYNVIVTDASGCSVNQSFTVSNQTGTLTQTWGNAADEVCGNGAGSVDIAISGGNTPYSYAWSNGATTQDLVGISAGTYSCVITDDDGCQLTTPVYTVNNLSGTLALSNVDVDDEDCGNGQGEIVLTVTGGTAPVTYAWNTGATTPALAGLSAGTYSCLITDASGCSVNTGTLNVLNQSGTLALTGVSTTDEICGNGLGAVNISISGGVAPISYLWNNGSTSQDLTAVGSGNYDCVVTSSNGCQVFASAFVSNDPGALAVVNAVVTDEVCGDATGAIDLMITGASAPVNYLWSNGATTEDQAMLTAGSYSVTITDNAGCTTSSTAVVNNQSGTLSVLTGTVTAEICGNSQGSIDITASGGTAPYTYSWSNGATTEDVTGLSTGNYSCDITDATGCVISTGNISVANSSGGVVITPNTITDEYCGNGNGLIDINVSGGSSPYTYLWNTGASTQDIGALSAGVYNVTVTDNNGCSNNNSFTVQNVTGTFAINSVAITDENCGNSAGNIDLEVTGGTAPYSYAWTNGATTQDISSLSDGGYQVLILDAAGCQIISPVYFVNNAAGTFALSSATVTDEVCNNGFGAINVVVTGGQVPLTFLWNNGATTQNLSGLSAGVYTCVATDANGCSFSFASTVLNSAGTLQVTNIIVSDATCGGSNGAVDVSVIGGTSPYSILWNNGSAIEDLTGLSAGNYMVSVTDASGCMVSQSVVVGNGGGQPVISGVTITNEICGNGEGAITANASGGTAPYTYSWGTGTNCCSYVLEMTDANNNGWGAGAGVKVYVNSVLIGTYLVPVGPGNSFASQVIPVCNGDQVQLEYVMPTGGNNNNSYVLKDAFGNVLLSTGFGPTAGISYNGIANCNSTGSGTLSSLSAGNYSLTVTDANGCTASGTYTVVNDAGTLQINNPVITDDFCGQGTGAVDITVTGGTPPVDILWNTGATTADISGLNAGTFSVTVTDDNGCSTSQLYVVNTNTGGFGISSVVVTDDFCNAGTGALDIEITGGAAPYSYSWSTGATTQDLSALVQGNYAVTVTDAAGCAIDSTIAVYNAGNGMSVTGVVNTENCGAADGSIDVSVTGGTSPYSYSWNTGDVTEDLVGLSFGTYTIAVTDATGCIENGTFNMTNTGVSVVSVTTVDENCGDGNGSATIIVTGGTTPYNYSWSSSAPCCTYTLDMVDSYGDSWNGGFIEVLIDGVSAGNFSAVGSGNLANFSVCTGQTIELNYTPGSWENENSYSLLDPSGNILFSDGPTPATGSVFTTAANCNSVSGGTSTNTTYTYSGLSSGTYSFGITDAGTCNSTVSVTINNNVGTLSVGLNGITSADCNLTNGGIDIAVTGGQSPYTYSWNNGVNTEDNMNVASGNYSVTVTDVTGCSIITNYTVNSNSTLSSGGVMVTDDYCGGNVGAIDITVSGGIAPYSFAWSNGAVTEDLSALSAGNYSVTVTDAVGCSYTETATLVNTTNGLAANAILNNATCGYPNGSIDVTTTGGTSPYTYLWNTGAVTEDINAIADGTYDVMITDAGGCSATYSFVLTNTGATISAFNVVDEVCGQGNGAIFATITSAVNPVSYTWTMTAGANNCCSYTLEMFDSYGDGWNGGQIEAFVNGNSMGTFAAAGNGSNASISVCTGDLLELVYTAGTWEEENTYNLLDASGNIIFSDGINPATGTVYNGTTNCAFSATGSPNINGLSAGTYTLSIVDNIGCVDTATIVVNNTSGSLGISAITTDENCGDSAGGIDITTTGGTTPYTYTWSNGATIEDLTMVPAGTYQFSVTDDLGCTIDSLFTIANITGGLTVTVFDSTGTYCGNNNGSIDILVSGGTAPYSYLWNTGAITEDLTGLLAGIYSVAVTDGVNCTVSLDVAIINATNGLSISGIVTDAVCTAINGAVDLTISGGTTPYSISWTNGATTDDITGLAGGSYTATVTDATGCIDYFNATVLTDAGDLAITSANVSDVWCGFPNGAVDITIGGGTAPYNYNWSSGATTQDINGITTGNYTVILTDANGCTDSDTYTVGASALFDVTDTLITQASCGTCADGAINITVPAGTYTYSWSNGAISQDISGVLPGTYTVTITDDNGCSLTETYEIPFSNGVDEFENIQVTVFPNPSSGLFEIKYSGNLSHIPEIKVYDMVGKLLISKTLQEKSNHQINLSVYEDGMYILEFISGEFKTTHRLVMTR